MKLGIIGLPQTGKKLLFSLLTGTPPAQIVTDSRKPYPGVAEIRDLRFSWLVEHFQPQKNAPARIDIQLIPKLDENSLTEKDLFVHLNDMDALCHIVRVFSDDAVYHVFGSINPKRDLDRINAELILHDLLFIEKRQERIAKDAKKKDAAGSTEIELLTRFKDHLEAGFPLRTLTLSEEEQKIISGYPLLTLKRMLIALNVDDQALSDTTMLEEIAAEYQSQDMNIMQFSAQFEAEIASLETEDEKKEFMNAAGIKEPALNLLTALAMGSLNLISYFTVGKDEVKQWLVRKGAAAPEAAGVIHSDIQRGFIRAEVMKYNDIKELGSEDAVKKAGKFSLMGKDYIVQDGDIMNFRFNV